ncbi:hypothetical protein BST12_05045 [Mycobacterium angelicum]|uniref:DUF2993 domain-containing protein n=1 Tax=Mycobacterium angelicum TaxID=470074 RepID=A0A1X0A496_MYCAN|nr:DUF2993 domain-containing protein [Mycobacterium angelicum]ORA24822.1 hypothetical protein BST12_05045 [Mycobacterium angelicum]
MTTPQGPSRGDSPEWNRPSRPPGAPKRPIPPAPQPAPPSDSPTRQIPGGGRSYPAPPPPNRPPPPRHPPGRQPYPPAPRPGPSGPPPGQQEQATTRLPTEPPPKVAQSRRRFSRRSVSVVLAILLAVIVAVAVGAELWVRHLATSKVAQAVQCEVQDSASVSFASMPPVLWQYLSSHYPDVSVQTAGNQVRSAKGMKVTIDIKDLRLSDANNSKGTIGALNGTITWSTEGIKESIQNAIPELGSFVASKVTTNPSAGTIELQGLLDSATLKPQIVNNGLSLQVVNLTALGSRMSTDTVQKYLDDLTAKATQNYPLGIHADSVKVTDSGVEATFSTTNATIPANSSSQTGHDCFSGA